jgi:hypothetical protein
MSLSVKSFEQMFAYTDQPPNSVCGRRTKPANSHRETYCNCINSIIFFRYEYCTVLYFTRQEAAFSNHYSNKVQLRSRRWCSTPFTQYSSVNVSSGSGSAPSRHCSIHCRLSLRFAPSAGLALTCTAQDTGSAAGGIPVYPASVTHQCVNLSPDLRARPQSSSFGTIESKLQKPPIFDSKKNPRKT